MGDNADSASSNSLVQPLKRTKFNFSRAFDAGDGMPVLTDDLIIHILTVTDDMDVMWKFAMTCSRWRRICKELINQFMEQRMNYLSTVKWNDMANTREYRMKSFLFELIKRSTETIMNERRNVPRETNTANCKLLAELAKGMRSETAYSWQIRDHHGNGADYFISGGNAREIERLLNASLPADANMRYSVHVKTIDNSELYGDFRCYNIKIYPMPGYDAERRS